MSYFKKWFVLFLIFILILILIFTFLTSNFIVFEPFLNGIKNDTINKNKNKNKNIVLIGDSILNNSVYVFEDESVPELIQIQIKKNKDKDNIKFYNFAKDGALISNCHDQILNLKLNYNSMNLDLNLDSTIFVSAGGNNILHSLINSELFINNLFSEYLQLIDAIKIKCPTAKIVALNLYYPLKSSLKSLYPLIKQWNQLLTDNSSKKGYQIIKLDEIIVSDEDIVYDVEPSFTGGQKIANAILKMV